MKSELSQVSESSDASLFDGMKDRHLETSDESYLGSTDEEVEYVPCRLANPRNSSSDSEFGVYKEDPRHEFINLTKKSKYPVIREFLHNEIINYFQK